MGDVDALASTLRSRLMVLGQGFHAVEMLRDADELAGLSPTNRFVSADPATIGRDRWRALLQLGRRADADQYLLANTVEAEQSGLRMALNTALINRASIATASGEFDRGKRLAAQAADSANRQLTAVELAYTAQILAARMEQGRLDEVIAVLQRLKGYSIPLPSWQAMLASVLADAGRHDDAALELDRLAEHIETGFADMYSAPLAIRHVPEALRQLGDRERAAALLPHVKRCSGTVLVLATSIEGAADHGLGHLLATLGRHDEADVLYNRAAEMERSASFPPLLARTQYWHARSLLERLALGDQARAIELLNDVVEVTGRIGMRLLHHQAAELAAP